MIILVVTCLGGTGTHDGPQNPTCVCACVITSENTDVIGMIGRLMISYATGNTNNIGPSQNRVFGPSILKV